MSKKITLVSSLIVLSLLITVTAFATADNSITERSRENHIISKLKFSGVTGTVTAVSGTNITISAATGNYTVDAANAKLNRGKATLKIVDIKIGDTIIVRGTVSGNNVSAKSIFDNAFPSNISIMGNHFVGSVTAINGTGFTIQTINKGMQKATQTVNTGDNTKFTKNLQPATLSDLAIGQKVMITGTRDSAANIITADSVNLFVNFAGTRLNGTVQSISGNILTVIDNKSAIHTVDAANAKIMAKKGRKASLSTIQINDKVSIFGTQSTGSPNITAKIIRDLSQSVKN
jgi:hypothetical protein